MKEICISELNPSYTAILELDKLLTEKGIKHELARLYDGYIIYYPNEEGRVGDVIEHEGGYGHNHNLMEAYGFKECRGDIIPNLTVDEALELFENAANIRRNVRHTAF